MKISIFQPENIKGHGHSGDLGVYGRIILKWIFNMVQKSLLDESDSSEDSLAVVYESNQGKYMSGSIKEGNLDHIDDYWLFKKLSAVMELVTSFALKKSTNNPFRV
jgi:hypothetical protein